MFNEKEYKEFVANKIMPGRSDRNRLLNAAVGISCESGELLNLVKKMVFYDRPVANTNLIEELGDVLFYLTWILNELNVSLEDIVKYNVAKLELRWGKGHMKSGKM